MQLFPVQMHVTVFQSAGAYGDWPRVLNHFDNQDALGKSTDVTLLPFGSNVPKEFPRLLMTFPKVSLNLECTSTALRLNWLKRPILLRADEEAKSVRRLAYEQLLLATSKFNIGIIRIASVVTWGATDMEDQAKWIEE